MIRKLALTAVAGALMIATSACVTTSAGDEPARPGSGASTTTTTTASTTSTAPTTTGPPTSPTAPSTVEPDGSGCTPGSGALPDGDWYGLVSTTAGTELEFDLACWFTGSDAVAAAAEDGEEPPPNDYYVRNENDVIRIVPVAPDAEVTWFPDFGDPTTETTVAYVEWVELIEDRDFSPGVWLEVAGGAIVAITEQWTP